MKVDGSRIAEIFSMADRLAGDAAAETGGVLDKKEEISNKWQQLQGSIQTYRFIFAHFFPPRRFCGFFIYLKSCKFQSTITNNTVILIREHLSIAGSIHAFQRDTDETLARIKAGLTKSFRVNVRTGINVSD